MKAIVILFDGEIDPKQENQFMSLLGKQVYDHTTAQVEQISMFVMKDEEVNNALIKAATSPQLKIIERSPSIEDIKDYCRTVVSSVGSPALMNKAVFRIEFLKRIQTDEKLRVLPILKALGERSNTKTIKEVLHGYGLSELPSYLPDVRALFRIYGYGDF